LHRLPDGLDTRISEGGASLSSGERQLISVARAFTADPEVIILDEATSYVDSQTEVHLQQAIANLMRGRTCVVVAHRLTTARTADRIVVLNNGVMVETGSHATLMARQGFITDSTNCKAVNRLCGSAPPPHAGCPWPCVQRMFAIIFNFSAYYGPFGTHIRPIHKSCQK
jgi:ABC-type transport system involved in cytochrome bd biosynthesis fused ATPase/permease subunit